MHLDLLAASWFCLNTSIKKEVQKSKKPLTLMRAASFFTGLITEAKDFLQLYFGKMLWQMSDTFCLSNIKF